MKIKNEQNSRYISTYKPEYADKLIAHMAKGYSFASFGAEANCSRKTLYDWAEAHEEFRQAKELGSSKSMKAWETIALTNAKTGIGSASQVQYQMSNRFPEDYANRRVIMGDAKAPLEVRHSGGIKLDLSKLTDKELETLEQIQSKLSTPAS